MTRIPFEHVLMDKRHQAFVEGKRDSLLSFAQVIGRGNLVTAFAMAAVGLWFLLQGISGLAYGFSVRDDWLTADATITAIFPVQSGDKFNWHYMYTFQTADGAQASGYTVQERRDVFREGQVLPVQYLHSNPGENVLLADSRLSKNVLYWLFVGIGALLVASVFHYRLYHGFRAYRALRRVAHHGQIVPGEIIDVRDTSKWYKDVEEMNYEIEYIFVSPIGSHMKKRDAVNILHATRPPERGMKVAVCCVGDAVAILL